MCGRYFMDEDDIELREIIAEVNRRLPNATVRASGEVRPADVAPVLAPDRRRRPSAFAMGWGYALPDGRRVINARSETAAEKPLFREGMAGRRCVVPASRYFEWERRSGARTKYAMGDAAGGLIYMAGLYRMEAGGPTFTILTRESAPNIAFIHDRMPVLLPKALVPAWLDPSADARPLLDGALTGVTFAKAPGEMEQLGMEL